MKKLYLPLFALLLACGPVRDSGCGGNVNSDDVEKTVGELFRTEVGCIKDDENTYTCTDAKAEKMYRCAESASASAKVKCIPWFPLE
jgi:hypothetical protein